MTSICALFSELGGDRRAVVPGVVWGAYPQAAEPVTRHAPRRRLLRDPRHAAAVAEGLLDAPSFDLAAIRMKLAREGFTTDSCAHALACAAATLHATCGLRAHPNQLLAAAHLLGQRAVELATGEGKTLVAALVAAVAALAGSAVHVLTANDYLARRDAAQHREFFAALGLLCGFAPGDGSLAARRTAWQADVCFATARTVAFDYLRDQTAEPGTHQPLLRGLCFAIVDEADSLLIDEAGTPLVLSESVVAPVADIDVHQALALARLLRAGRDFAAGTVVDSARLTPAGQARIAALLERSATAAPPRDVPRWLNARHAADIVTQALTALHALERNVHYLVRDDAIVLVDVTTGRTAPGRQFAGELHRLVCAKEGLVPPEPTAQRTGLTWPRFFARYHHLCALSGTLNEVRAELRDVYGLKLVRISTHRPTRLRQLPARQFARRSQQFKAAVMRARQLARTGRPVLIGTDSVADARLLAQGFARARIPVTIIDAANEADEAEQIREAGVAGRITISTQIAGRGTDIVPDERAVANGGLHVLNLQHNRSPRIDRQMIGRAARQGHPGSAEHWVRLSKSALDPARFGPVSGAILRPWRRLRTGAVIVWLAQQMWQFDDRSRRRQRLRADQRSAAQLHFSRMARQ